MKNSKFGRWCKVFLRKCYFSEKIPIKICKAEIILVVARRFVVLCTKMDWFGGSSGILRNNFGVVVNSVLISLHVWDRKTRKYLYRYTMYRFTRNLLNIICTRGRKISFCDSWCHKFFVKFSSSVVTKF